MENLYLVVVGCPACYYGPETFKEKEFTSRREARAYAQQAAKCGWKVEILEYPYGLTEAIRRGARSRGSKNE